MSKLISPHWLFRPSARWVVVMLLSAFGLTLTPSATFAVGGIVSDEASCTALGGVWAPDPDFSCTVTTLDIGNGEQLDIQVNATLIVNGILNNEGTLRNLGTFIKNNSSSVINNQGTISNDGTLNNDGTINNNGVINNNATGTINNNNIIDNNNSIINNGSINNNFFGVIHNNATGTLQNNSALNSNGTIDNSGAIIGAFGNTGTVNDECGTFSVEPEGAVVDQCAPTVSITVPANNATVNTATPLITGSAADARSGVQFVEIKIDAGVYELASGTTSWSFTPSALSDGSHTITVRATDNANNVSSEQSITIMVNNDALGVSINQAATQADPTDGTPINFTVLFNEPINVASFVDSDIDLSDSTAGGTLSAVVTQIAPNDGTTFNVAVSGMESSGNVVAALAAEVVLDLDGNGNTASTSTDNTVAFDNNVPSVAMSSASSEPTNVSPIPVTVQFSEDVSGFTAEDIVATNGTVGGFTITDGNTYSFNLIPSGQGVVSANIAADVAQDATSNGNTAATQFSRTFDNVAPIVTMNSITSDPTNVSSIPVTVQFSEDVSGFTAGDIVATNGTVGGFTIIDDNTYTFNLMPYGHGN